MKRIYVELPDAPDVRYVRSARLPGFLLVNTDAEDSKVARVLFRLDNLDNAVIENLKLTYIRQQKKRLCPPASEAQPKH